MGIFGRPTAWRATSAWSTLIRLPQIGPYLNDTDRPEPLKFFRTMRSSWSRAICYDLLPEKHGPVAQRLEQGTHNPLVPGSNPGGPSFISEFIFAAQSSESNFALKILFRRIVCGALIALEIAILSLLILATRCANYQDVFVAGNVYFTDADCYARMTRVR